MPMRHLTLLLLVLASAATSASASVLESENTIAGKHLVLQAGVHNSYCGDADVLVQVGYTNKYCSGSATLIAS